MATDFKVIRLKFKTRIEMADVKFLLSGPDSYGLVTSVLHGHRLTTDVDGQRIEATVERFQGAERRLQVGERHFRIQSVDQGLSVLVEVDGVPHRISRDRGGLVRAPSPAVVVNVLVSEGRRVAAALLPV